MLNRTNRKLSAKNTGLNLGTRKFAVKANANLGNLTLIPAARPHYVRVGSWDVQDSVGLDAIRRSYPSMRSMSRITSSTDSSARRLTLSQQGCPARTSGQIDRVATRIAAGSVPSEAELRERRQVEPGARFPLAPTPLGLFPSVPPRSMIRNQRPEATP